MIDEEQFYYRSQSQESPQKQLLYVNSDKNKYAQNVKMIQHMIYQFPVKITEISEIPPPAKQNFRYFMQQQSQGRGYEKGWNIQDSILKSKVRRILIRCAGCKAYLKFNETDNGGWKLHEYKNHHIHSNSNKKVEQVLVEKAYLSGNTQEFPIKLQKQIHYDHPFGVYESKKTKAQANKQKYFDVLKKYLEDYQYNFRQEFNQYDTKKEGLPDLLVAVSPRQRANYRQFGEIISYDITYNCVKQCSFQQRKYGIGVFSGFDCNNRIILFGFSLTASELVQDFKKIFSWFFDIMGFTKTTAIITDHRQSLINGLKQLKKEQGYQYHQILDNWHFIKSFRLTLKSVQKQTINQIIEKLLKTMKQSDPNMGICWQQELRSQMYSSELVDQYHNLSTQFDNICLWRFPKQFVGLSRHSNEQINHVLKLKIQHNLTLSKVVDRLNQISRQRVEYSITKRVYEKYTFEYLYEDQCIEEIRQKFQKKVFNTFIFYYRRSELYRLEIVRQGYRIIHLVEEYAYIITNWICPCGTLEKLGVPCEHLIFLRRELKPVEGYADLFNTRWLTQLKIEYSKKDKGKEMKLANRKLKQHKLK